MPYTPAYTRDEPPREDLDGSSGPLLVEFGTDWCPLCQAIQPPLAAALARHPEIRHLKIEDGAGRPLGRSFRVKLWPNFVLMRDGRVLRQLARPTPAELDSAVRELAS